MGFFSAGVVFSRDARRRISSSCVWTISGRDLAHAGRGRRIAQEASRVAGRQALRSAVAAEDRSDLRQRLAGPTLKNIAAGNHLAIVLDRRIDPDQTLSLTSCGRAAGGHPAPDRRDRGIGLSLWEPIVYFGPPQDAAALRALAWLRREEAAALPAPRRAGTFGRSRLGLGRSGHSARSGCRSWPAKPK